MSTVMLSMVLNRVMVGVQGRGLMEGVRSCSGPLGPPVAAAEAEAGVGGGALVGARLGRAGTTGGLVSEPRTGWPVLSKEEAEKRRRKHVDLYAHISVSCSLCWLKLLSDTCACFTEG